MTRILSTLHVGYLDNDRFAMLDQPFGFISDVLIKHKLRQVGWELRPAGHEDEIWLPLAFVFDFESIPNLLRGPIGENKRGGAGHDGVSRKNIIVCWDGSCEGITKSIAADVYFEIMEYCDSIDNQRFAAAKHPYLPMPVIVPYVKTKDWFRRWLKSTVVRVWPGFWQKYEVTATAKEIYGIEGDPYVTIEKIDAAIEQSKQATDEIKAIPAEVEQKADLVEASEKVTADLKDVKADVMEKVEEKK
jgi:hypothetical protein